MSLSINYRRLYLAYGANSNMSNMSLRCPRAIPVGTYILSGYEIVFQGVANVRPRKKSKTHCVLWNITKECENNQSQKHLNKNKFIKSNLNLEVVDLNKRDKNVVSKV